MEIPLLANEAMTFLHQVLNDFSDESMEKVLNYVTVIQLACPFVLIQQRKGFGLNPVLNI